MIPVAITMIVFVMAIAAGIPIVGLAPVAAVSPIHASTFLGFDPAILIPRQRGNGQIECADGGECGQE